MASLFARRPDLGLRQLRAVLAVARHNSFIAAAAALGVSQPALTRLIQQVEATLGVALFARNTRQVSLTPAGRTFVEIAERLEADLELAIRALREVAGLERGQLVIATVLSVAHEVVPDVVGEYRRRHPGIDIHLREGLQADVLEDVRAGLADFGIGYVGDAPAPIVEEPLWREDFYVVLPREHRLATLDSVAIEELRDEPLVAMPPQSRLRRALDGAAATAGITLRPVATVREFATLYGLLRHGVGVAVVPGAVLPPPYDPVLVARPITARPRLSRALGVLRLRDREPSPAARAFLQMLRARGAPTSMRRQKKVMRKPE